MTRLLLLALALAAGGPAAAQFGVPADPCPPGTAEARLRGALVEAALFTNGNLFFGNQTTNGDGYLVPRATGHSPLYMANLWIGGIVEGEVRTAAARYTGLQFRPGLTGPDGVPPTPAECAAADHVWILTADPSGDPGRDTEILSWPTALGAPVIDGDGVPDNYDLEGGDRPAVRGDVSAFWTMTDTPADRAAANCTSCQSLPLGVDVAVEAFGFAHGTLGTTTIYRFTITNRNAVPIDEAYVGLYADPDLGNSSDDYVGTDTTAHMSFTYNGNENDAVYGVPPALGVVVLEGPLADANGQDDDRDGEVDEPGEQMLLATAAPIEKAGGEENTGEPVSPITFYHRLRGLWGDGSPVYEYGIGYNQPGHPTTVFAYPGDPVNALAWSEENVDGAGTAQGTRDSRMLATTGPAHLEPGESTVVTFAVAYAQGADRLDSVTRLRGLAAVLHRAQEGGGFALHEADVRFVPSPAIPLTLGRPSPNPFRGATTLSFRERGAATPTQAEVTVYDALGRRVDGPFAVTASVDGRFEVGAGLAPGVYVVRVAGLGFDEALTVTKLP